MDGFSEIFQAMIQDHGQRPRNFGTIEGATCSAEGVNPITGDRLEIFVTTTPGDEPGRITEIKFTGKASALATTSASVMTCQLAAMTLPDARDFVEQSLRWISGEEDVPGDLSEDEYAILLEIRNFPHRIPCASLAWKTAACALREIN